MKLALTVLLALLWSFDARAALQTEVIEYRHGDAVLEGYMAWDDAVRGKRPGVLVVHEWMGHNPYARRRADQLAQLGYTAFALDMFGKGVKPEDAREASEVSGRFKSDRALMRARANAGLEVLKKHPTVDPQKLAAIGYCFGGTVALELARGGADLDGVVSFHGNLDTPNLSDAKNIKGPVLALHGGDDPYVPAEQLATFMDEMRRAGVDWQVHIYGGAVHGFTNPDSGSDNSKGLAYNERADRRSWAEMRQFFDQIFK